MKTEEKKCETYISKQSTTLNNHDFTQKGSDGKCIKCGIVVSGKVLDTLLQQQKT